MTRFLAGFASAYLLAAVYFCALFVATDAIRPPGAAPAVALIWPVSMLRAFYYHPGPSR